MISLRVVSRQVRFSLFHRFGELFTIYTLCVQCDGHADVVLTLALPKGDRVLYISP